MKKIILLFIVLAFNPLQINAQDSNCAGNCQTYYQQNIEAIQEEYFYSTGQECSPFVNENEGDFALYEAYFEGAEVVNPIASLNALDQFYDCVSELDNQTSEMMSQVADTYFECLSNC